MGILNRHMGILNRHETEGFTNKLNLQIETNSVLKKNQNCHHQDKHSKTLVTGEDF